MEWPRLQRGGFLLPDLIELYQWLHSNIAHLLTYDQAATMTIGHVITQAEKNSSKESGQHLRALYERVKMNYNNYVELIGGAIGAGACAAVRRGNKIFTIADDIPLLHFLTGKDVVAMVGEREKCVILEETIIDTLSLPFLPVKCPLLNISSCQVQMLLDSCHATKYFFIVVSSLRCGGGGTRQ